MPTFRKLRVSVTTTRRIVIAGQSAFCARCNAFVDVYDTPGSAHDRAGALSTRLTHRLLGNGDIVCDTIEVKP